MMRIDPIDNPPGILITARGPISRQVIRDRLKSLHLEYTELPGSWGKIQFIVTLPDGARSGRIPEWLAKRMKEDDK